MIPYTPLLISQSHDRHTCVSFTEITDPVGLDPLLPAEVFVHRFPQCSGTFSVYDAYTLQMGDTGFIQVFVEFPDGVICSESQEVELR